MIVEFLHDDPILAKDTEICRYMRQLSSVISMGERFIVYGLILAKEEILYILTLKSSPGLLNIVSSEFFDVLDHSASRHWAVLTHTSNKYMRHFTTEFENFTYVGVPRIVSDPEFFLKYHSDDTDAISYIAQMKKALEEESMST